MAENVGHLLDQHAAGLDHATTSLMKNAFINDNFSKVAMRERLKDLFKLPPVVFSEYMLYEDTVPLAPDAPAGTVPQTQKKLIKWNFSVPGFIFDNGTGLEIKKYGIKSTFESMIKKHNELTSDTDAHIKGSFSLFSIPKISIDIAEKIHTGRTGDEESHNTFDIDIEMGQSDPSFGYIEIVKAFVRAVNRTLDIILSKGGTPISEDEAKQLEDAGTPTEEKNANAEHPDQDQQAA